MRRLGCSIPIAVAFLSASSCHDANTDPPSNCIVDAGVRAGSTGSSVDDFVVRGQQIFRFDTFGDEAYWGGQLQLHRAIAGAAHGGIGPGLSPQAALTLGLKVDADALPASLVNALQAKQVDLNDPASTLALIQNNAVIGVQATFAADGTLTGVGITCAICHSTVDDSFAPGIGHRLDGWANRDLNVGQVIALAPNLAPLAAVLGVDEPTVRTVLQSWGPGKFDAELILDGKAFRPDGATAATLIPPAFGMAGVNLHTWTGWGSVPEWNAFVAVLEMHGIGNFADFRLADAARFPIAAKNHFDHVVVPPEQDHVSGKLPALQVYQLSLLPPSAPAGSFDAAAAGRGASLFVGKARCATCHVPPLYTDSGFNAHPAAEIGIDDFQARRGPIDAYRTSPLRGLFTHQKGGFYHDGRFPTLGAVVDHYDSVLSLGLTPSEKSDLVEYVKSL